MGNNEEPELNSLVLLCLMKRKIYINSLFFCLCFEFREHSISFLSTTVRLKELRVGKRTYSKFTFLTVEHLLWTWSL